MSEFNDETYIYIVSSKWSTTIHLALMTTRGRSQELVVVQDHPNCQVGSEYVTRHGHGWRASYVGMKKDAPADLMNKRNLNMCKRCWQIDRQSKGYVPPVGQHA